LIGGIEKIGMKCSPLVANADGRDSMPKRLLDVIDARIAQFRQQVVNNLGKWTQARTPQAFIEVEQQAHAATRKLVDDVVAAVLMYIVADAAFQAQCLAGAHSVATYVSKGIRQTRVSLLGGHTYLVSSQYLVPPTRRTRRRNRGAGLWPCLAALGIWWNTSPALSGETSRQISDSCSFRDALEALKRRGIDLGYKRTLALYQRFSQRAVAQRNAWVKKMTNAAKTTAGPLKGKTVLVSTDGGRCRQRLPKRGRRQANGHHRYDTPWREPKEFVIYVLDKKGRPDPKCRPFYDGTMGDCDDIFMMLWAHLAALGAHEAKRVIFVADGAKWIWCRTALLWAGVGLDPEKVVEVVDWYHAVETLHTIAKACRWNDSRRKAWVRKVQGYLHRGNVERVVSEIEALAVGRRAKAVLEHRDYFQRNADRMRYQLLRAKGLPMGSGAMESTVRRVINLKLKSPGKFWLLVNAEATLHLRSYLKAGHWDHLVNRTLDCAIPWSNHQVPFLPELSCAS
jgi:hypothetical protein